MTVGQRIKKRRKELGLSVDEVAEKLGKNRATIYRYESNEIEKLPTTILEPLAKVLNTTPSYLMGWDDNDNSENSQTAEAPSPPKSNKVSDDDIMFALFNGSEGVTDEMFDEVKQFAEMVKMREKFKKKGNDE